MYRNILVATDLTDVSENALLVAVNLARRFHTRLNVLHALESPYIMYRSLVGDRLTGKLREADAEYVAEVRQLVERELADKLEGFEDYGVEVREGLPFVEILKRAKKDGSELIVMGPHTGGAAERGLTRAGSTMLRVTAKARCPVMVVGRLDWRGVRDSYEHVLFATDFSPHCRTAFGVARTTAELYGARLSLLHVLAVSPALGQPYPGQGTIEEELEAARDGLEVTYGPDLAAVSNWQVSCCEGVPFVEILKFARERGADLIVMGPHTHSELEHPGSTVEQVGLRAGCPVMIVPR